MSKTHPLLLKYGFRKLARVMDPRTDKCVDVIQYKCRSGGVRKIAILPSALLDTAGVVRFLADKDAVMPGKLGTCRTLAQALYAAKPETRATYVDGSGWVKPGGQFIFQKEVIGPRLPGHQWPRDEPTEDPRRSLITRGTAGTWRRSVGKLAGHSSLMMCVCGAAFGAPLLEPLSMEGFGFCIFGPSRAGKSLSTRVAASVIGLLDLPTWSLTEGWLGEHLPAFKDLIFPVDELANLKGAARGKYERIADLAHYMASGWEKGRHSSFAGASTQASGRWRSICLTQFEEALSSLPTGGPKHVGVALRMIDLPAVQRGCDDVFDRAPAGLTAADRTTWRERHIEALVSGCQSNQGAAFLFYVEKLCAARDKSIRAARSYLSEFEKHVRRPWDDDAARDLARRIGVMFAGNRLAHDFGVVRWKPDDILGAAVRCYRSARDLLPTKNNQMRAGIRTLSDALNALPELKAVVAGQAGQASGYREQRHGKTIYVVKVEEFGRIVGGEPQKVEMLQWLVARQRIALMSKRTPARPKEQFEWPDGHRHRSYKIIWPLNRRAKKAKAPGSSHR